MNIAQRIQHIRKRNGISQEKLANEIGVSRQAVSKWESEQSVPEIDKIIILSDYFKVSTDYLIKGEETLKENNKNIIISKVLYNISTILIILGLIFTFAFWYETQNTREIFLGLLIQTIGIGCYFSARTISKIKAPFKIKLVNSIVLLFMPLSILLSLLIIRIPYPYPFLEKTIFILFIIIYGIISIFVYRYLKNKENN